ncbi:MAG: 5-formyltetrahydrofolate cyclo-ligase [Bacillota bacterium]
MAAGDPAPPGGPADKAAARRAFLARRLALGPAAAGRLSERAQLRLLDHGIFAWTAVLMVYLPFRGEADTGLVVRAGLDAGRVVCAPATVREGRRLVPLRLSGRADELRKGCYGILEPDPARCPPVDPEDIDLVVVPGVAFDETGGRLGYGGGYYDRFLGLEARRAVRAGLAFEAQISPTPFALDPHDARMDFVFTEERIIRGVREPAAGPGPGRGTPEAGGDGRETRWSHER